MLQVRKFVIPFAFVMLGTMNSHAQDSANLSALSSYRTPASGWQMAGDVITDLDKNNSFKISPGSAILVNVFGQQSKPTDLYTITEHGDADIELDFMMARGSNSGIYLQGNYEIQLFDSWGKSNVTAGDNGAVYERWDDARGVGKQGFEGIAPRQAVSKAPGLWQHLSISFQAPRFDAEGKKKSNAKIIRAELNGVLIHEQVEITGPTHGGDGVEKAAGPLRLQGDHGSVAFRNIRLRKFNSKRPELTAISYAVFKSATDRKADLTKTKTIQSGKLTLLNASMNGLADTFLIQYKGTIKIEEAGSYRFKLSTAAGLGSLMINNKEIAFFKRPFGEITATLPAGELPFELRYSKSMDWAKPSIGLSIAGPGIREFIISDQNGTGSEPVDPILIHANTNTVLRSFIDIPQKRVVHAVSVGSPEGTHYTYDPENGAIVQAWHGNFLDATPMWHERGDGSSRAMGSIVYLDPPNINITTSDNAGVAWRTDTSSTGFRPNGYRLDQAERPVFRYTVYGQPVQDSIWLPGTGGLSRQISFGKDGQDTRRDFVFRLAVSDSIIANDDNLFTIGDKQWYIRVDNDADTKLSIRTNGNRKELVAICKKELRYTIIF